MKMREINFRKLRADEIQVRPTDTRRKGSCLLLLYQDARCAMNILDETVGQFGWQKRYDNINGNIYCGIAIKDTDTNEWVWKYDCGAFTAKEEDMQSKADASDATKRAAVCWGIGRELYATPKLKITCPESYYYNDKLTMIFAVKSIEWDGDKLVDLVVVDKFGKVVYDYRGGNREQPQMTEEEKFFQMDNKELLIQFCRETKPTLKTEQMVGELERFYKFYSPKMDGWKGNLNLESLWNNWVSRMKK
jgi:hypothetical protein